MRFLYIVLCSNWLCALCQVFPGFSCPNLYSESIGRLTGIYNKADCLWIRLNLTQLSMAHLIIKVVLPFRSHLPRVSELSLPLILLPPLPNCLLIIRIPLSPIFVRVVGFNGTSIDPLGKKLWLSVYGQSI